MRGRSWMLVMGVVAACGGKQNEQQELMECRQRLTQTQEANQMCTRNLEAVQAKAKATSEQLAAAGNSQDWVVRMEGEVVTVTAPTRPAPSPVQPVGSAPAAAIPPVDTAATVVEPDIDAQEVSKLTTSIVHQVRGSRSAIQRCYTHALKQNQTLQARAIQGKMTLTLNPTGGVAKTSFSPNLSADFNTCLASVARRWRIPAYQGSQIPFELPVTLQPME